MLKWLWLSLLALILDQASKLAVISGMQLYQSIPLLPSFNLTYVHNTGAAFSFLSAESGWQRWFFAGLALVMSIVIAAWLAKLEKHETLLAAALSLILGGAVGNLIDRLAYGYVIDFLDVYYGNWHFATFNIADSAISLGAFLMFAEAFGWLGQAKDKKNTNG